MARPSDAAAILVRQATERHRAGDRAAAGRLYLEARALVPDQPEALHGLGCLAYEAGEAGLAIAMIGRAIRAAPDDRGFHVMLSRALLAAGHAEAARVAGQVACRDLPGSVEAQAAHASALAASGRPDEAMAAFDRAVALDPSHVLVRDGRARLSLSRGAPAAALADLEAVVRLVPGDASARANLGAVLNGLGRHAAAVEALDAAVALDPGRAASRSMRGLARLGAGLVGPAIEDLAAARDASPGEDAFGRNLAAGLTEADRRGEARAILAEILSRAPDDRDARFTLGCIDLAEGSFEAGWAGYEARPGVSLDRSGPIAWDGGRLEGTLLLVAEQGLGDTLMFLRYVELARARVGDVVLALPAALLRLGSGLGRCVALERVLRDGVRPETGAASAWCRIGSLPAVLGTGGAIPAPAAFGTAAVRPGSAPELRVGLAWAGNAAYRQDRRRSIEPSLLAPLGAVRGVSFVSLQPGAVPAALPFVAPFMPGPADLQDTAARIAGLDLVVSVDSVAVHLAGTLGVRTWLLDRVGGDWRWGRGRCDSDWYPSVEIVRARSAEPPAEVWPEVVARVVERLRALVAERGGR